MKTKSITRLGRKTLAKVIAGALALSGAGLASAQVPVLDTGYVTVAPQNLQQVVAPVALYPDALLAQTLVASTYPQDVESAADWLRAGGDPAQADYQPWDDSVKGLVHDPDALYLLADNYDWMNDLGAAFLNQRADTMTAVQLVRQHAYSAGELTSNTYQTVICEDQAIQIIPANPEVIYVPVYQPLVILGEQAVIVQPSSVISFGVGIEVGTWLRQDCDWHDHDVYVGDWGWHRPWWEHPDFDHGRQVNVYVNNRPGHYVNNVTNVTNVRNVTNIRNVNNVTNLNVQQAGRWEHDARKPAPQAQARAASKPAAIPQRSVATRETAPKATAVAHAPPAAPAHQATRPQPAAVTPTIRPVATAAIKPQAPARQPAAPVRQPTVAAAPPKPADRPVATVRPASASPVVTRPAAKTEPARAAAPAVHPVAPPTAARETAKPQPTRQPAPVVHQTPQPTHQPVAASRSTVAAERPTRSPAPARAPAAPARAPVAAAPAHSAAAPSRSAAPAGKSAGRTPVVRVASTRTH